MQATEEAEDWPYRTDPATHNYASFVQSNFNVPTYRNQAYSQIDPINPAGLVPPPVD